MMKKKEVKLREGKGRIIYLQEIIKHKKGRLFGKLNFKVYLLQGQKDIIFLITLDMNVFCSLLILFLLFLYVGPIKIKSELNFIPILCVWYQRLKFRTVPEF